MDDFARAAGRRLGPRRRVVPAVAVWAVVVALVGTATFRLAAPGEPGLARADAATVQALELGARSAEAQAPPAPLTPGRFLFTHSIGAVMNGEGQTTLYLVQTDRRSWIGADGAFRLVERTTPGRLLAGSPEVWRAAVRRLRAIAGPQVMPLSDAGPTILDNLRHAGVGEGVLAAHVDDPAGLAALLREAAPRRLRPGGRAGGGGHRASRAPRHRGGARGRRRAARAHLRPGHLGAARRAGGCGRSR